MPTSAPADGADKGTSECDVCTGGGAGHGKDPYVGSFPSPSVKTTSGAYDVTGGDGD